MKDYSLNYDDSKKFILSYKIENGKIVAKLASGESCTVPYSEENENKIISRMEEQARYAQPKPLKMLDKILTISQPLMLPIAIMNFVNNGGWFYGMFLAIIVEGAIYYPAKTIINAIKKRDIKKLNYFLDHKEELNENIEKSEKSENIKLGVSKKAIKQIELQKSKNKQPFNINNIDNSINNENKSSNYDAKTIAYNLAKKIYELDSNVYESVGSELGRVFIGDADKCLDKLSALIYTNPHGYLLRSEVALVGNMARTIKDKEAKSKFMRQYNDILNEIAELPHGFGSVDILDTSISELNVSNFHRNNNDNRMIICISRTEGSAGTDIGFALADKLRLNYYDAEIFKDLVIRKDAEKDARWKSKKIDLSHEMINPEKARRFSRNHGLPANDAAFFNESEILRELAEKEDFIVIGRCADVILKNNNIPHVSVFITAPVQQRARRIMELEKIPYSKALKRLVKLDKKRERYYKFYTNNIWGQAYNYDLCINSASYGIDEAVNLILRVINRDK